MSFDHSSDSSLTTEVIIHSVSSLLADLCQTNDARRTHHPHLAGLTRFHGLKQAPITIPDYLTRIRNHSRCSNSCFVIALLYLDRAQTNAPSVAVDSLSVHRLILTAVLLASKVFDDRPQSNKTFATIGGISSAEMSRLEIELVNALEFELDICPDIYAASEALLKQRFESNIPAASRPSSAITKPTSPRSHSSLSPRNAVVSSSAEGQPVSPRGHAPLPMSPGAAGRPSVRPRPHLRVANSSAATSSTLAPTSVSSPRHQKLHLFSQDGSAAVASPIVSTSEEKLSPRHQRFFPSPSSPGPHSLVPSLNLPACARDSPFFSNSPALSTPCSMVSPSSASFHGASDTPSPSGSANGTTEDWQSPVNANAAACLSPAMASMIINAA